jgi:beta-aspartyl-peptidase (threonine type)
MLHGGAGTLAQVRSDADAAPYLDAIHATLEEGRRILAGGGTALDAVEACCARLEDDPLFNAGRGSVLNADGQIEMDAGIMDGATLRAGAVAAVHHVASPIALARLVLARSAHVLLGGEGAMAFAEACGVMRVPEAYLIPAARRDEWGRSRAIAGGPPPPADAATGHGTVGAVAWDRAGNLAAATSTGGTVNKHPGRIGDSPIIGAGVYADNATCAVSATGRGEDLLYGHGEDHRRPHRAARAGHPPGGRGRHGASAAQGGWARRGHRHRPQWPLCRRVHHPTPGPWVDRAWRGAPGAHLTR